MFVLFIHLCLFFKSDAIGMGLNLNIKRIIFSTLQKFDGKVRRHLTPSEIKQVKRNKTNMNE